MRFEDEAAFVAELRRLKASAGLSFRQLERQAAKAGDSLPASTAATMLGKSRLPREELLAAYVRVCGASDDEVAEWLRARTELVVGPSPQRHRPARRWRLLPAAVALIVAFTAGTVFTAGLNADANAEQESVAANP